MIWIFLYVLYICLKGHDQQVMLRTGHKSCHKPPDATLRSGHCYQFFFRIFISLDSPCSTSNVLTTKFILLDLAVVSAEAENGDQCRVIMAVDFE